MAANGEKIEFEKLYLFRPRERINYGYKGENSDNVLYEDDSSIETDLNEEEN